MSYRRLGLSVWTIVGLAVLGVSAQDVNALKAGYSSSSLLEPMVYTTCDLSDKHWTILRLYFSRVPTVEVTDLINNNSITRFPFKIIRNLTENASSIIRLYQYIVNQQLEKNEKPFVNYSTNPVRQIYNYRAPPRSNYIRRDESAFGALIYTDDIAGLRQLIEGPVQHPFENPDGNYFIILTSRTLEPDWQNVAAFLLELLWTKLHIIFAVIISACDANKQIGFYDPFEFDESTMRWGVVKWSHIDVIDEHHFWILSYTTNWHRYPINTAMFLRYPTLIDTNEIPARYLNSYMLNVAKYSANLTGFDGVILGNMAKTQNFTVVPIFNVDKYGVRQPNNTFNGVIGNLLNNEAEIAINSRFLIDYDTPDIDFLHPIFADKFCVIAPAAAERPQWTAIFRCFNLSAWLFIVGVQIICAFIWVAFRHNSVRRGRESRRLTTSVSLFEMYKIFISYPATMPVPNVEIVFLASCLLTNIIIVGTFRGSFTKTMWTVAYEPEMDTLQQLDNSGLPIATSASSVKNVFGDRSDSPLLRSLQDKQRAFVTTNTSASSIEIVAFERTICSIQRYLDINIVIQTSYTDPSGRPLVHIVEECPRSYLLSYIIKRGNPYRYRFNRLIDQFYEAGLLMMWYHNLESALIAAKKSNNNIAEDNEHSLTLMDMQTPFYILFIGLAMSLIVFVIEIVVDSKQDKDHWNAYLLPQFLQRNPDRRKSKTFNLPNKRRSLFQNRIRPSND